MRITWPNGGNPGGKDGVVRLKQEYYGEWEDLNGAYPGYKAALYIYCDHCGSFSIRSYLSPGKWLLIGLTSLLISMGIFGLFSFAGGIYWFLISAAISFVVDTLFWGSADYKCRQCGKRTSSIYNTLDLAPSANGLTIPEKLAQKREVLYVPEQEDLDGALRSPKGYPSGRGSRDVLVWAGKAILVVLSIPFVVIFLAVFEILPFIWILIGGTIWGEKVAAWFDRRRSLHR